MNAQIYLLITTILASNAKILRNNALMSKMVSNFHKDNDVSTTELGKSQPVLHRMQNLLCKNFPSIPCELITQDATLRGLIEKSIQQINYKKLRMEKTTMSPRYLALFPIIDSRDLNFERKPKQRKHKYKHKDRNLYSRKKIRKFYPHKVKYKDKNVKNFGDSDEKLSMSVEVPDATQQRKHQRVTYKVEGDQPIWRIDYMKHGEPSINMFGYEDRLKDKIVKSGQDVVMDDLERKDVLHPDVYIKKRNFARKNLDLNDDI
ncbi:unnamed protein product [Leptosia nina]|uniref:Uncharacterized protein n=1 Tax=Leptosia nina TaxID=320188 RepID=A0AAV1JGM7_9NEOP